jgi:apolipoprotein N-acyltransferase
MDEDVERVERRFRPLRPESRARLIATVAVGPLFWWVAIDIGTVVVYRFDAIAVGVFVVIASFSLAAIVLSLLWLGRRRQERRYARGA